MANDPLRGAGTAPPVYKPAVRASSAAAPPVYRPHQGGAGKSGIQPKLAAAFSIPAPSAPPVYKPVGAQSKPALPSYKPVAAKPGSILRKAAPIIQRYTTVTDGPFQGKMSQNGSYITGEDLSEIYVVPGNTVLRSARTTRTKTINGVTYEVWVPAFTVIEDCVAAMEEILHGKKLKYGAPDISEYSALKGKRKRTFGESDDENRKRGLATDKGEDADPGLLEGFVIARQAYNTKRARPQFHGAAVVATDGDDRITLEATAPLSGSPSSTRVTPIYDMYAVGKRRKQSFKIAFKGEYGKDATVSVVRPRKRLPKKALVPMSSKRVVEWT